MTTLTLLLIVLFAVAAGLFISRIIPAAQTYLMYRGRRLITCPETLTKEAVDLAAAEAATLTFFCEPVLRVNQCSRWPEHGDCGQECVRQIEEDPVNSRLWNIVSDWFEGQRCVFCNERFGPLRILEPPALMGPNHKTVEWDDFKPEQLPRLFLTYKPVCWSCHVSHTFQNILPESAVSEKS